MPINFSLLSLKTSSINGINQEIDKRCSSYKRRVEALQSAPDQVPAMIDRALSNGIEAFYVLMDTWFTQTSNKGLMSLLWLRIRRNAIKLMVN